MFTILVETWMPDECTIEKEVKADETLELHIERCGCSCQANPFCPTKPEDAALGGRFVPLKIPELLLLHYRISRCSKVSTWFPLVQTDFVADLSGKYRNQLYCETFSEELTSSEQTSNRVRNVSIISAQGGIICDHRKPISSLRGTLQ